MPEGTDARRYTLRPGAQWLPLNTLSMRQA